MKYSLKKTAFLLIVMMILCQIGYSKEKTVRCQWTLTPLNIDGSSQDWRAEELIFEKKLQAEYAFKNDGENLFALFIFKDPKYLSSINATGMTVWFNLEGKKKKKYGINFIKKKVKPENFIVLMEQRRGPLSEEEKNEIRSRPEYFLHNARVISTKKSEVKAATGEEVKPAIFRSAQQQNGVVYEFSIPLERKTETASGVGAEPGKLIKVCFEWGGLTAQQKAARMARVVRGADSRNRPADPVVRPEEAMDRGTGAGRMSKTKGTPKKYDFWVNVQLAKSQ